MKPKFQKGDKCRVNKKAPAHVRHDLGLQRTRTIVAITYDPIAERNIYYLGERGKGHFPHGLRPFMLNKVTKEQLARVGPPKRKREYRRRGE